MTEVVWEGGDALRGLLVPVTHLERHPQNPRRGEIAAIRESLRRWGQTHAILTDGRRVIAGNHTLAAAVEEGWTHVAAVKNEFASADEARAYLLADNRIGDLGSYDDESRQRLLEDLERSGAWEGTGYTPDDLEDLRSLNDAVPTTEPEPFGGDYAVGEDELAARRDLLAAGRTLAEVPLLLDQDQSAQFDVFIRTLRPHHAPGGGVTEVVLSAVRAVALRRNQGK